jgi:protein arginine N-methyltransferase 3
MAYSDSDAASSVGSIVEDASEPDTTTFKCLFCEQQWSRVDEMSTHCKSEHSFDLATTIKDLGPSSSTMLRALPLWDTY